MELVKYRDSGMNSYTWFWVNADKRIVSPFFDSEKQAKEWLESTCNEVTGTRPVT